MKIFLLSFCFLIFGYQTIIQASPTHSQEKDPTKVLFAAIRNSDVDKAKTAIDDGADVNAKFNYTDDEDYSFFAHWNAIHVAAYYGKIDIILLLVSKGAKVKVSINNPDEEYPEHQGYTPIHFTAFHESEDQEAILDLFISKGLSINEEGNHGWLPINSAIISDYCTEKGIKNLIKKGANVNPDARMSPLCWALNYDANEKFIAIMEAGGNINAEVGYAEGMGDGPCSILDVALYEGNNYIAKLLIEKGADIKSRTSFGYSRLHWCAMGGNRSMAYYFMKKGLDPNEKATANGRTPLSIAQSDPARYAGVLEVLESGYLSKAEQQLYDLLATKEYQDLNAGKSYKGENFSVKNIKGGTLTLEGYKGKVLFLNIWGTWCPPCVREMPSMQTLYDKMKGKNFAMLASSYEEDFDKIKSFITEKGFTFDVAQDADQSLVTAYPSVMPTSYIIDKKGNVIAKIDGSTDWSQEKYIKLFELLVQM